MYTQVESFPCFIFFHPGAPVQEKAAGGDDKVYYNKKREHALAHHIFLESV